MRRTHLILLGFIAALPCSAQKLTVVIDAARGGNEYGARIDEHTYEKQITLDMANRLRSLLTARDFNVVLTRENDTLVTNEQRAAVANQNKPVACLLLHATGAGTGLHLWTSSLTAMPVGSTAVLWDQAQAPFVQRSQRLASEFAAAFSRSKIAVSSGHTWIRPLDNMQCPAVALEIAPEDTDTPASDRTYQAHLADAIASQLLFWRGHADVVESILNPPPPPAAAPKPTAPNKPGDTTSPARTRTATGSSPADSTPPVPRVRRIPPAAGSNPATTPATNAPRPGPATPSPEAQPQ
ncbi:N-acetylmuramoyl-L-alanine amidase [Terriglobus sp.]|uniref:N-acetylmuramoyl-L-alanine amidase n=1 Tax=Terriglobus sp. TaxID=1889013 RepID=UPI003B00DF26